MINESMVKGRSLFYPALNNIDEIEFIIKEIFEDDIYQSGKCTIQKGDVVLDIGSFIGLFAVKAFESGASKVIGCEPNPVASQCCIFNLASSSEFIIQHVALGSNSRSGKLKINEEFQGQCYVSDEGEVDIQIQTVDELIDNLNIPVVNFIKIDVEGDERHVLEGARNTIKTHHPRMAICTYHLDDDLAVIPSIINSIDNSYKHHTVDHGNGSGESIVTYFY